MPKYTSIVLAKVPVGVSTAATNLGTVTSITAGAGLNGGTITNSGTISLANVGAAGTYTKVVTDAQGRVTQGLSLIAADITGALGSTATFPASGIVVTRDATETLTNKTLSAATINGASSIEGSTKISTTGTASTGALTAASVSSQGNVTILGNSSTANKLVLNDKGSTNSVALKAPDTLASSLTWELPSTNGSPGQVLSTNGSGTLSWVSAATGSVTNVTGTAPISVATGTSTPVISMSQANDTTNGYLSSADWTAFNNKQTAGNYIIELTGDVTATGPGSAAAALASVAIQGTSTKVTYDAKGRVRSGTSLTAADIPPLSADVITSGTLAAVNGGTGVNSTATFPNDGVIVTRDATETLTNKTLSVAVINGTSSISGSTTINTTGTVNSGAQTVDGNVTILGNGTTANKLVLNDKGSTNSVALKAPDTLGSSLIWELPSTNGSSGQLLSTNGSGTLSWTSGAAPTGAAGGDLTGNFPGPSLAAVGTAGTYTKVTTDSKGRVISGSSLTAGDLPPISANSLNTGTLAVANGGTVWHIGRSQWWYRCYDFSRI